MAVLDVVHSDEYEEFMRNLKLFHQRIGSVTLRTEPILGNQIIDLMKLYKIVTGYGGFEKVNENKTWRAVSQQFNMPESITAAAFCLKAIYTGSLLQFEKENFFGEYQHSAVEIPIKHKNYSQLFTQRTTNISKRSQDGTLIISKNIENANRANYDREKIQQFQMRAGYPQSQIDWFLHGGYKNRIMLALASKLPNEVDWAINKLLIISFAAPENFSFIMVPNLLDCLLELTIEPMKLLNVLNGIYSVMCRAREGVNIESSKTSYDHIFIRLLSVFLGESKKPNSYFTFPLFTPTQMERTLQLLHIFRNFSFLPNCVYHLLNSQQLLNFIKVVLSYQSHSSTTKGNVHLNLKVADTDPSELRVYGLEILDNLSPFMEIKDRSHCFVQLVERIILYSNDKALIFPALKILVNFISNIPVFSSSNAVKLKIANNEQLARFVNRRIMKRVLKLLLVWDEELVSVSLEWLYAVSSNLLKFQNTVGLKRAPVLNQTRPGDASSGDFNVVGWQLLSAAKKQEEEDSLEPVVEEEEENKPVEEVDNDEDPLIYSVHNEIWPEESDGNLITSDLLSCFMDAFVQDGFCPSEESGIVVRMTNQRVSGGTGTITPTGPQASFSTSLNQQLNDLNHRELCGSSSCVMGNSLESTFPILQTTSSTFDPILNQDELKYIQPGEQMNHSYPPIINGTFSSYGYSECVESDGTFGSVLVRLLVKFLAWRWKGLSSPSPEKTENVTPEANPEEENNVIKWMKKHFVEDETAIISQVEIYTQYLIFRDSSTQSKSLSIVQFMVLLQSQFPSILLKMVPSSKLKQWNVSTDDIRSTNTSGGVNKKRIPGVLETGQSTNAWMIQGLRPIPFENLEKGESMETLETEDNNSMGTLTEANNSNENLAESSRSKRLRENDQDDEDDKKKAGDESDSDSGLRRSSRPRKSTQEVEDENEETSEEESEEDGEEKSKTEVTNSNETLDSSQKSQATPMTQPSLNIPQGPVNPMSQFNGMNPAMMNPNLMNGSNFRRPPQFQKRPQPEVTGVPLIAALLLRNLSRCNELKDLFLPYESQLIKYVTSASSSSQSRDRLDFNGGDGFSKILVGVLFELSRDAEHRLTGDL